MDTTNFNPDRHRELNLYFKERLQHLLATDPQLQNQVAAGHSLQLEEIIESMTLNDQHLWQEFLQLDQQKMHLDLQNHLEGKGNPLHGQSGFYRQSQADEASDETLW